MLQNKFKGSQEKMEESCRIFNPLYLLPVEIKCPLCSTNEGPQGKKGMHAIPKGVQITASVLILQR